ncbi:Os06g0613800 [Oryza sativa Japonica Group]|uniref:Os06g0613800 protein n=2 Tax=Oryza TaxID=4527 RepID=C7J4B8_ORYSJ|nr:Os06g0613800 [Oryza sativa Japonica Group]|eukprot:NP_001174902.1 Os06g0613800 [Oryza sativa Japonica Group]
MSKRRGNCSSSNEEKKTCTNSRKKGDQTHFSGTGIVVRNKDEVTTSILTSANVIRCFDDDSKINPFLDVVLLALSLQIRVLLPNKQRVIGWMGHFDLNYNIAVVVIKYLPGLRAASFDHEVRFGSQSKDMAGGPLIDLDGNFVGMNFFSEERTPFLPRNKIYRSLVRSCTLWVEIDDECTSIIERCRSKMIHNNFVGTSRGVAKKRNQEQTVSITSFSEGTSDEENESETQKLPEYSTSDSEDFWEEELFPELIKPLPDDEFTQLLKKDLKSRNYPMPIRFWGGMRLKNTFEEEFAEDTWCKLSKKVALNTSQSVVSLASFKGEERFFACTGVFIDFNGSTSRVVTSASLVRISADENKIADNLKIKVYLPNKRIAVGELQHCNLSYNIAVVSVKGFCCLRTAELDKQMQIEPHREVVAIGRIFESGKLMATSGILSDEESKLDCRELMISTCKITKAGIGGPLIDFDGNFVGINFYGTKETHYLPRLMIQRLLKDFDG